MGHLGRFTKTPYLVLFILLGAIGVSTATAMVMVTISGNFTVTGDSDLQGNVGVGGTLTPVDYADDSIQLDDLSPELKELLGLCSKQSHLGFVFEGEITNITDPDNLLGGLIAVGETWSTFYCLDPNTPDTQPGNPTGGEYVIDFIAITIGDNDEFVCTDFQIINIVNGASFDSYQLFCFGMNPPDESPSTFNIALLTTNTALFADDSLPAFAPDLNDFDGQTLSWNLGTVQKAIVLGTITSFVQVQ